jgi:hypothetical protein
MQDNTVTIYVDLPEEGSPTLRQTQALSFGGNVFQLLPDDDYDPEDEVWQFLPYTYVKGEMRKNGKEIILVAIEQVIL